MWKGLHCLMFSGLPLNDAAGTLLYKTACEMFADSKKRKRVKSADCDAVVQTNFDLARIGSICGTKFTAVIENGAGKTTATFIIRDRDLEAAMQHGVWINEATTLTGTSGSSNSMYN